MPIEQGPADAPGQHSALVPEIDLPPVLQTVIERAPMLERPVQFGWRLSERWNFDRCPLIAAAMAFFGLLSLFPTLLAALAFLGKYLAHDTSLRNAFLHFVSSFFPGPSAQILDAQVESIKNSPNAAAIGLVSFASLLWSGRAYFDTLASVLNTMWPNARPRTFLQHQIALWGTFAGAGLVWLISTASTLALETARAIGDELPDLFFNRQPVVWLILGRLTTWLLSVWMFWLIYRFLPNAAPGGRSKAALGSALVAAVGWEIAKFAFTHFLGNAARCGAIYGSVAGVVLTLMWLYISSSVILLGAEAGAAYAEVMAMARGEAKPTLDKPSDPMLHPEAATSEPPDPAQIFAVEPSRDEETSRR